MTSERIILFGCAKDAFSKRADDLRDRYAHSRVLRLGCNDDVLFRLGAIGHPLVKLSQRSKTVVGVTLSTNHNLSVLQDIFECFELTAWAESPRIDSWGLDDTYASDDQSILAPFVALADANGSAYLKAYLRNKGVTDDELSTPNDLRAKYLYDIGANYSRNERLSVWEFLYLFTRTTNLFIACKLFALSDLDPRFCNDTLTLISAYDSRLGPNATPLTQRLLQLCVQALFARFVAYPSTLSYCLLHDNEVFVKTLTCMPANVALGFTNDIVSWFGDTFVRNARAYEELAYVLCHTLGNESQILHHEHERVARRLFRAICNRHVCVWIVALPLQVLLRKTEVVRGCHLMLRALESFRFENENIFTALDIINTCLILRGAAPIHHILFLRGRRRRRRVTATIRAKGLDRTEAERLLLTTVDDNQKAILWFVQNTLRNDFYHLGSLVFEYPIYLERSREELAIMPNDPYARYDESLEGMVDVFGTTACHDKANDEDDGTCWFARSPSNRLIANNRGIALFEHVTRVRATHLCVKHDSRNVTKWFVQRQQHGGDGSLNVQAIEAYAYDHWIRYGLTGNRRIVSTDIYRRIVHEMFTVVSNV